MKHFCRFSTQIFLCGILFVLPTPLFSQNVNITTPVQTVNDSFYENMGVNFGFAIPGGRGIGSRVVGLSPGGQLTPNLAFSQNLGGGAPLGGATGSGGQLNFGAQGSGGGFSGGLNFAQGSGRTSTTTTATLTTFNGSRGSIASGQFMPFTAGFVPVVGQTQFNQPIDNAVTRSINSGQLDLTNSGYREERRYRSQSRQIYSDPNSTAIRGDASVVSIKAARQRQLDRKRREVERKLSEAQKLLDRKQVVDARIKFREALQLTQDKQVKQDIKARIAATRKN